jgi:hypothetical protein
MGKPRLVDGGPHPASAAKRTTLALFLLLLPLAAHAPGWEGGEPLVCVLAPEDDPAGLAEGPDGLGLGDLAPAAGGGPGRGSFAAAASEAPSADNGQDPGPAFLETQQAGPTLIAALSVPGTEQKFAADLGVPGDVFGPPTDLDVAPGGVPPTDPAPGPDLPPNSLPKQAFGTDPPATGSPTGGPDDGGGPPPPPLPPTGGGPLDPPDPRPPVKDTFTPPSDPALETQPPTLTPPKDEPDDNPGGSTLPGAGGGTPVPEPAGLGVVILALTLALRTGARRLVGGSCKRGSSRSGS